MSIWPIAGFASWIWVIQCRTIRHSPRTGPLIVCIANDCRVRHGRFRESGLFRHMFQVVLQRCMDEGLVGGHSFGIDASLIPANANQTRGVESKEGLPEDRPAHPGLGQIQTNRRNILT